MHLCKVKRVSSYLIVVNTRILLLLKVGLWRKVGGSK